MMDVYLLCIVVQTQTGGVTARDRIQIPVMSREVRHQPCCSNSTNSSLLQEWQLNKPDTVQPTSLSNAYIDFDNTAQWGLPIREKAYYDQLRDAAVCSQSSSSTTSSSTVVTQDPPNSDLPTTATSLHGTLKTSASTSSDNRHLNSCMLPSFDSVFKY